jgi:CheY-like chemotaxis protein
MQQAKGSDGLSILCVEDHYDTAEAMCLLLQMEGHTVQLAGDIGSAVNLARGGRFDLLLCDVGLPDGDGRQLLRQLRQEPGHADLRGIILSAHGMEQDVESAMAAGYDAYLKKPVQMGELLALVKQVCPQFGATT